MRTLPFDAMQARGIEAAITIGLFNATLRVTTGSEDRVIDGETFVSQGGTNLTQILQATDGTPLSADVRITPDGAIVTRGMARRGLLDGRPIKIEIYDPEDIAAGTYDMIPNATIGAADEDTNDVIVIAAQGPLALFSGALTETHSILCRAKYGDDRCHKPLLVPEIGRGVAFVTRATPTLFIYTRDVWGRVFQSGSFNNLVYECTTAGTTHASVQPTYPVIVGGTVTDGTAVFTARAAEVTAVVGEALGFFEIQLTATPSPEPSVTGNIIPQDGPLAGIRVPIRAWDSGTNIVTTMEPFAPSNFPTSTNFLIHPGCDKRFETCRDDKNNKDNFVGTPYAPGTDNATGRA